MTFAFDLPILATLGAVALLIAADVLIAIVLAVARKEFDVRLLPEFLLSDGLPFVLLSILAAASMLKITVQGVPEGVANLPFVGLFWSGALFQIAKQTADIKDKLAGHLGD